MSSTRVFCDGSITNAEMSGPFESRMTETYVGRVMVLVPDHDFGLISQRREGVLTKRGTPDSAFVEELAIRAALAFAEARGLVGFEVFSDCTGAVGAVGDPRVRWASRESLYLPNAFFDKVLKRASYLRESERRGVKRRPVEPYQTEIFELFCAPDREFRLSNSPLWARVSRDAERHGDQVLRR